MVPYLLLLVLQVLQLVAIVLLVHFPVLAPQLVRTALPVFMPVMLDPSLVPHAHLAQDSPILVPRLFKVVSVARQARLHPVVPLCAHHASLELFLQCKTPPTRLYVLLVQQGLIQTLLVPHLVFNVILVIILLVLEVLYQVVHRVRLARLAQLLVELALRFAFLVGLVHFPKVLVPTQMPLAYRADEELIPMRQG